MMRVGYGRTSWAWRWAPVFPSVFLGWQVTDDGWLSVWAISADALVGP